MAEDKIEYYKRGFLNSVGHGMAAFEANVDCDDNRYVSAGFSITDCSRKVSLDFDCWEEKDIQNARDKLNTLITELRIFRTVFNDAVALMQKKQEERKAEREAAEAATKQEGE